VSIGLLALSTLVGLTVVPGAAAKEVHFDPNSPAGQEYALPLAEARKDATGKRSSRESPGAPAPLFGIGISKAGSSADAVAARDEERPARSNDGRPSPEGRRSEPLAAESGIPRARLSDLGGGYSAVSGAAIVAAIVFAGAGIALALRGLQRLAPPPSRH
jgi:hypothetical protein